MLKPDYKVAKDRTKVEIKYQNVDEKIKNIYKGKKYFLRTYGCQMNVHDSEAIASYLEKLGFTKTDVLEQSDIVVLNTCAIRENAHDKVFGYLGRCKHLKKEKKDLIIVLMGCMAGQEDVVEEIEKNHKYVDIVVGPNNLFDLPHLLIEKLDKQNILVHSNSDVVPEGFDYKRDSKVSAWVNVMFGCDKFCTYCIVPYTRGKQRSRTKEYILNEVNELVKNGYQEVTLLGQNVNAYGKDLNNDYGMENLLEDVAKTGISRIRFVTSHPWDFTDKMIEVIKNNKNIMPYIHLPLQSGSNNVLKLMGRRYTKEHYLELYRKLKEALPYSSITTDIIVGFPNETIEDFNETLEVVDKCQFDSAFTFIFSPRVGTPAAKMEDNVGIEEKNRRLQELNKKINNYARIANEKYLNTVVKVLIESVSEKDEDVLVGYTDTMKLVNVKNIDKSNIGKIVDVKITDVKTWSMTGELV